MTGTNGRRLYPAMECVGEPSTFACLSWRDYMDNGRPKMWCYSSISDCVSQNLPGCTEVSATDLRIGWGAASQEDGDDSENSAPTTGQ